jgi:hypothetical protein
MHLLLPINRKLDLSRFLSSVPHQATEQQMSTITTVKTEVPRDRWGRPLITPPEGGKPVAYTRATTLAGTMDDRNALEKWMCRQTALGLADRTDLYVAVSAHRDDKQRLNQIVQEAQDAAKSSAAATRGTAVHALTELVDLDQPLPSLPDDVASDLDAYRNAMRRVEVEAVEQFLVCDELQAAGTADRIVRLDGTRYILDLKTGSTLNYSWGAIAQQLAIYAHGTIYNPADGTRTPIDVDRDIAIVAHLPAGQGTCQLWTVNIEHGWHAAQLSARVRAYRRHARNGLATTMS